ncbi:MAG: hypothetical protein FD149_927 [Rhodospirillaceae bacterium]|nr:MAG: hypothetical protein FD149_927 [Rhodospirillaceae bacterium]
MISCILWFMTRKCHFSSRHCVCAAVVAAVALSFSGKTGAEETGAGTACALVRQECELLCNHQYTPGSAAHAGCLVRCDTDAAACKTAPWLERQMERLRQFYDGFTGGEGETLRPAPKHPVPPNGDSEERERGAPEKTTRPHPLPI